MTESRPRHRRHPPQPLWLAPDERFGFEAACLVDTPGCEGPNQSSENRCSVCTRRVGTQLDWA